MKKWQKLNKWISIFFHFFSKASLLIRPSPIPAENTPFKTLSCSLHAFDKL